MNNRQIPTPKSEAPQVPPVPVANQEPKVSEAKAEELNVPTLNEPAPMGPAETNGELPGVAAFEDNNQEVLPPVPNGIEVVATKDGFYRQQRRKKGQIFTVGTMKELGSWMSPTDPKIKKAHQEALKARQLELKKAAEEREARIAGLAKLGLSK